MTEQVLQRILEELLDLKTGQNEITVRLDRVDQRLDRVDQRLDRVDQRLDRVEQKIDRLDQKIDDYHAENINADEKILSLLLQQKSRVDTLELSIDILNRRQLRLEAEFEKSLR